MRAKALFVMILGLFSQNVQAQISGDPGVNHCDSFSITSAAPPSFQITQPLGIPRFQIHQRRFPSMDADMTVEHLPFFCRQEYKFERASGIPLRMRLGSVPQTDWLEQKVHTDAPR